MTTPRWRTKSYAIVGWLMFGLIMLFGIVDIILDRWPILPTFSQYITARDQAEPWFGYIVMAIMVFLTPYLIYHWFFDKSRRKNKR